MSFIDHSRSHVVIVGAGHGGGNMVANLRQAGHLGPITLIGDEPHVPYHRPPLSKAYLKGGAPVETLHLRPRSYYEGAGVVLKLGRRAISLDLQARTVALDGGERIAWDVLVLATGSRARRLTIPGAALAGVHHLRSLADADAIRADIRPGRRLAIVGGGYVGLEAAASAIGMGATATLIEREPRILARVACAPLAAFFDAYHRARGVEIVTDAGVEAFDGTDGHVAAVRLADGRAIACDAVLVGVGGIVADELARDAGIACENGVVVDDEARTSAPGIYAIGDLCWRPMPLYGGRMFRLESVPNAIEGARRAAADIMGKAPPAHEVPWFWSDQYDLKLQIAGVPFDSHRLVVRGAIEAGKFAIWHLGDTGSPGQGRVLAVEAVNMPAEFMAGRALVGDARIVEDAGLADSAIPIKEIVKG